MKDKLTIEIDLKPIHQYIEKYLKRKIVRYLQQEIDGIIRDIDYPTITVEDSIEDIEKLVDWKREIEQGWIDMSKYCYRCKTKG